jgi:hypothetical protein
MEKRIEFCECMDLKAMITDEFTLSKNQKEAKRKGCMWIENELSEQEIALKIINCASSAPSNSNKTENTSPTSIPEKTEDTINNSSITENSSGQATVIMDKAYFYDSSNELTIRKSYILNGEQVSYTSRENGFIYVEYTNTNNKTTTGWMQDSDFEFN